MAKPDGMKHTPGRWRVTRQSVNCTYVGTSGGRTIAAFGGFDTSQSMRDARRVVDLVNCLKGIEIEEIRKFASLYRMKRARKTKKAIQIGIE